MRVLVIDTETTGLPDYKNPKIKTPKWYEYYPDIVQVSWLLYDMDKDSIVNSGDYYIKIDGSVPPETTKIHGITDEILQEKGIPFHQFQGIFNIILSQTHTIVAHNLDFDKNMLVSNYLKHNLKNPFDAYNIQEFCTMKNGVDVCNLQREIERGGKKGKYPRLFQLHEHYFPNDMLNMKSLHNSMVDVLVCFRCYYAMIKARDVLKKNTTIVNMMKQFCII